MAEYPPVVIVHGRGVVSSAQVLESRTTFFALRPFFRLFVIIVK